MRQNISMSASCMTRTTGRAVSGEMVLNSETLPCDLLCIDSWCEPIEEWTVIELGLEVIWRASERRAAAVVELVEEQTVNELGFCVV
jgi:hypothetical protein